MAPQPKFFDSTDTTEISATIAAAINAGSSLAAVTYRLWNWKGGAGDTLTDARLRAVVKDGSNYVTSGYPALDEAWLQVRVTAATKTGDPTMEDQTTGWTPIGANRSLQLFDIPNNCARSIEVRIVVPAGQSNVTQELHLEVVYNETTVVLPFRLTILSGNGVIPERLDPNIRRLKSGRGLTAAGTEVVTIAAGGWTYDGYDAFRMADIVTLNQTAADGALGVGQSYIATISQATSFHADGYAQTAATATKGNKGASPTAPAVPADHILLGYVTVTYQGGGTSVINTANLDMTSVSYGGYLVTADTGLNVKVWRGSALSSADAQPFKTGGYSTVAVPDNSATDVWLNADGTFSTATAASFSVVITPPSAGSQRLAEVTTSGGAVTAIVDKRSWVDRAITEDVMTLRYLGSLDSSAQGFNLDFDFLSHNSVLDRYLVGARVGGGGGSVKVDILMSDPGTGIGTPTESIFDTSTTDLRPVITNPGGLAATWAIESNHVRRFFRDSTTFAIQIVTGHSSFTDLVVKLYFRRGYGQ